MFIARKWVTQLGIVNFQPLAFFKGKVRDRALLVNATIVEDPLDADSSDDLIK